jgi:hypothetical protein
MLAAVNSAGRFFARWLNGPTITSTKVRNLFEEVSELPRRQQDKVVEFVSALVEQYKRKAS